MSDSVSKNRLKVYVKMSDGQRMLGYLFISTDERLQDILNDERTFLPLHALSDNGKYQLVVLSKRFIQQVEEVSAPNFESLSHDNSTSGDRRSGADRRDQADSNSVDSNKIDRSSETSAPKFELD